MKIDTKDQFQRIIRQALAGYNIEPDQLESAVQEGASKLERTLTRWSGDGTIHQPVAASEQEVDALINRVRAVLDPPTALVQSRRAEKRAVKHRRNIKKGRRS